MKYGRYEIIKELGRGAMGVVYQAHDPQIDRLVAIKVLRKDRVTTNDFVRRFLKEAKAVGRLSHPGIVTVYDIGQDHETIYIAMEYLDGNPLDRIMAGQKFSPEEIVDIGCQVALALDYAHRKGVVHRDIKPPNIIVTSDGLVKVTDFGIARIEDGAGQQQTRVGEILGTPLYMSPEQVSGLTVDGKSDIYSLGIILYELATAKRPFKRANLTAIFKAITQDIPQPPVEVSPEVPLTLSSVIMQCLDKDPVKRYPSGQTLASSLSDSLKIPEESTLETQYLQVEVQSQASPEGQAKLTPTVLVALFLVILAIGGTLYYRFSNGKAVEPGIAGEATPVQENAASKKDQVTLEPVSHKQEAINQTGVAIYTTLKVKSRPVGARTFVNGDFMGITPIDLKLPADKYEIHLSLKGYLDWQAQLDLSGGGEVPLKRRLLPDS